METKVEKSKQNGKASNGDVKNIKTNGVDLSKNGKINENLNDKEIIPVPEKKEETKELKMSIDEKISKIEDLKIIIDKREKLIDSRKKLNSFTLGSHHSNECVTITDGNGHTFSATNTEVLTAVIDTIRNIIDDKVKEAENLINF